MEEKIKIYIPESINNILLKDMERFEFFKNDGSINKNEFYNSLVINYYEQYQEQQSDYFDFIKKTISEETNNSDAVINDIATKIIDYIDLKTNNLDNEPSQITISIKPTKKSSDVFDFIQNYSLGNSTLSSYFRNMFASYALLSQDKRERIIFKQNFDLIEKAIEQGKKIYFTTIKSDTPHIASPFTISNSKEELFNYMLAESNLKPYSFRVGRLRKIKILNEQSEVAKENIEIFNSMIEYGPQFAYNKKEESCFQLTEYGQKMYKSYYVHRPKTTKIEGDKYYFECSKEQLKLYFSRFGKDAFPIYPESLRSELHMFYGIAKKHYNKHVHELEFINKENNK